MWRKGEKKSPEEVALSVAAIKGKPRSDATRKKISEVRKGIKFTEEHKQHLREARKKVLSNPEFIKRLSENSKNAWNSPGFKESVLPKRIGNPNIISGRQRSSEKQKGRKRPEEQCKNVSAGMKSFLEKNPESKLRRIHSLRAKKRKTSIEKIVEEILCSIGIEFYPEHHFDGVGFVDFWLPDANLVIECDGAYWHSLPKQIEKDRLRDEKHHEDGRRVFRLPAAVIEGPREELLEQIGSVING